MAMLRPPLTAPVQEARRIMDSVGSVAILPPSALGTREVIGALEIARAAARDPARAAELCAYVVGRVRGYETVAVRVGVARARTRRPGAPQDRRTSRG